MFKHRINLYRRYVHWYKESCIYIHIPKAAGTSLNKAIYGRTLGHYSASEIRSKFPALFEEAFVFSFVRNPWDRVLSAYRFAKIGKTMSMGVHKPEQYQMPEFDTFERFLLDWLVNQDVRKIDYIFQPQYSYVCDENGCLMIDYLGKVESLTDNVKEVEKIIKRKIIVGHENSTSFNADYRGAYLSRDMIEAVRSIYKRDIDLFNYHF